MKEAVDGSGGKETQPERGGKAVGDRAWCHSPWFVPLTGAGWVKTYCCYGGFVQGFGEGKRGTRGVGVGRGFLPNSTLWGFGPRGDLEVFVV